MQNSMDGPDRVSLPIPPPVDSSQQRNMTEQPQSSNTYTDVVRIHRNSLGMALSPPESMAEVGSFEFVAFGIHLFLL